jgi:hypothetical protein
MPVTAGIIFLALFIFSNKKLLEIFQRQEEVAIGLHGHQS